MKIVEFSKKSPTVKDSRIDVNLPLHGLEDEDDVNGQPAEGEDDDDDEHHFDDSFLVLDGLGRSPAAGRLVPQAVQHHRVKPANQQQRQQVRRHEK